MTLIEALEALRDQKLVSITPEYYTEYKDYFIFAPHGPRAKNDAIALNKNTGKLVPFKPTLIGLDELHHPLSKGYVAEQLANDSYSLVGEEFIKHYFADD